MAIIILDRYDGSDTLTHVCGNAFVGAAGPKIVNSKELDGVALRSDLTAPDDSAPRVDRSDGPHVGRKFSTELGA